MKKNLSLVPIERIEHIIYIVRGQKIILDRDLAMLYDVSTKNLNKAVNRNSQRFPEDFMFQLSKDELQNWKFQIGTSNSRLRMGLRKRPFAFTEQGVAMLSGLLRSPQAITVNIEIMRTFVRLRQWVAFNEKFTKEFQELRSFVLKRFNKTDQEFAKIWRAFDKLLTPPTQQKGRMEFDWGLD